MVKGMLEEEGEEILSVYQLREEHWRRLRSTNMVERYQQELRRRTRVVRILPSEGSCLRHKSQRQVLTPAEIVPKNVP